MTGTTIKRIAIFAGSSVGTDPDHLSLARDVGRQIAERGIGLVYGGGRVGLMGAVADGALDAHGAVIGVIPRVMVEREWAHQGLTHVHICSTMHERKATMAMLADAFAVLPGGLGTLEELFEVWTWQQLGFHVKPLGFLNAKGYWDSLLSAVAALSSHGFLSATAMVDLVVEPEFPAMLDAFSLKGLGT